MLAKRIKDDFMLSYKNKDFKTKNILWLVKWQILLLEKDWIVTDWKVIQIIKKLLNWINETLKIKETPELLEEKLIYESYLPKQLTEKEIIIIINRLEDPKNIWTVMKYFKENYEWLVDNKMIMNILKK